MAIAITKAHAYGNDFLFTPVNQVAEIDGNVRAELARRICDRHSGIGADGLVYYDLTEAGAAMTLHNADGGLAEVSGNAVRCLAALVAGERRDLRTLVIETDQFAGGSSGLTSINMHLVERLTRIDADTVAYEYTVTDPTVYESDYSVMMPLRRTDQNIFEYACHEGNIGMHGILAGARRLESQGRELRP